MFELREITIEDKAYFDSLLEGCNHGILEYNFTSTFIWRSIFNTKIADNSNFLILASGKSKTSFLYPYGKGDVEDAIKEIINYCHQNGITPRFHSILVPMRDKLEKMYPGRFEFVHTRDTGDYIYETESLMTLSGKKLSSKRNHINRFEEAHPDWTYEKITRENIDEVYEMNLEWCKLQDCSKSESLRQEACAVKQAFEHFFDLKLDGGFIRTDGKIVAFSMGDRLDDNTYLVHIEKAFADIQGAYPMINKHFVINNASGYKFVDREDDTGDEGLRKAKLSYRPHIIAEKYYATWKD